MATPTPIIVSHDELRSAFGMGIAGNFAGHLEQAGEAADFVNVAASAELPQGIFPWYAPGSGTFLGAYPLSSTTLAIPSSESATLAIPSSESTTLVTPSGEVAVPDSTIADPNDGAPVPRIQIEPELGVMCDIVRAPSGTISRLRPRWVAAFDDCSLRRPGARFISEKKNWGACSKGIAPTAFAVTDIDRDGILAALRLTCLLTRDGETHQYGVDSAIATYTLFGEELLDWCIERLANQRSSNDTPLEDVGALLADSGAERVLIGVGATRYEPYGETTFVQPGDAANVVLYDADVHTSDQIRCAAERNEHQSLTAASVLHRAAAVPTP